MEEVSAACWPAGPGLLQASSGASLCICCCLHAQPLSLWLLTAAVSRSQVRPLLCVLTGSPACPACCCCPVPHRYGEKIVKGSPCPRSYYKCSQLNCGAKKIVERDNNTGAVTGTEYKVCLSQSRDAQVLIDSGGASLSASSWTPWVLVVVSQALSVVVAQAQCTR